MKKVTAEAIDTIPGIITKGNLYDGVWVTVHQRTPNNPVIETEECLVIYGEDDNCHCVAAEYIGEIQDRAEAT